MPTLLVDDVIELRMHGTLFNQKMINVFHYRVATIPTDPEYFGSMDNFLSGVDASTMKSTYLGCCPSDYKLDHIIAQRVSAAREVYAQRFIGQDGTGAAANPAQNANAVITLRTGHIGNHTKDVITNWGSTGSIHLPGVPGTAVVAGLVEAAYLVTMGLFTQAYLLGITPTLAGFYKPCIWHRNFLPQPSSDDVLNTINQPQVRIMRRRTVGQGI